MTELETHLLNALEQLQQDYMIPGTGASAGNTGTHAGWSFAGMVKP
nr:MbeD/MobD family mobilization/exclusion protein [Escherichia coli]